MYYGALLLSSVPKGTITKIDYPALDDRFITVTAEDIPGSRLFTAFDGAVPLLAGDTVSFQNQPILAIFGPDYESVTIASRETNIIYDTESKEQDNELIDSNSEPLTFSWGEDFITQNEDGEPLKAITTLSSNASHTTDDSTIVTCSCWLENSRLHIEIPCQWPQLVKQNAAAAISFPEQNVIVHSKAYYAEHDEYLCMPSIIASIAAVATIKTGMAVELRANIYSHTPQMTIRRTTYCNQEGKPISENADMLIDQGAFLFVSEELQKQAMAGLIPVYPLECFKASIKIQSSSNPPSLFFGSAGYAEALASSELQTNEIADTFQINPLLWRSQWMSEKRRFTDYLPSLDYNILLKECREVTNKSDFDRKWSSFEGQHGDMSLIPFSRGVGLATGISISGFSTSFSKKCEYSAKLTMTEKGNITLNTSFQTKGNTATILRRIIASEMDLNEDNDIIILDKEASTIDSGPDILSRSIGRFPKQLMSGCRKLMQAKAKTKPPISILIDTDDKLNPCEFEAHGSVAIAVEIRTDNITFLPTVQEVWCEATVGSICNKTELSAKIRHDILSSLKDSGAVFSTLSAKRPLAINISIHSDNTDNTVSLSEAIQGLTKAAFTSALKQCAGKLNAAYPITAESLENAINGKGEDK